MPPPPPQKKAHVAFETCVVQAVSPEAFGAPAEGNLRASSILRELLREVPSSCFPRPVKMIPKAAGVTYIYIYILIYKDPGVLKCKKY